MPSPGLTGHHQQKSEEWPTAILVPCDMPSSSLPTSIIRSPDSNHKPWVLLTHPPSYSCVIANFTCQVDWIMRCPDSWLNIISGCGCEGVSGRVAICILSKVDGPPQCEWHHSVCWGSEKNKKGRGKLTLLSAWMHELERRSFYFSDLHSWIWIHSTGSLSFRPSKYSTSFPGSPACRQQILGSLSLHNCMSHYPIVNLFVGVNVYNMYFLLVLFPLRTLVNRPCLPLTFQLYHHSLPWDHQNLSH